MLAVIIPAYNRKEVLEEALISLTIQTKKRFITVLVDDASTEDFSSLIKEYSKKLHLKYIRREVNGGPGAARNDGLQWCFDNNIELVMFLDSDDLLLPKAIERLSKEINVNNCDIVTSEIQGEDKYGFSFLIKDKETIWTHGKIYRTSFLKQINLNFPDIRVNEDVAFNTVAFFSAYQNKRVAKIEEQLYFWRHEKNSITRTQQNIEDFLYNSNFGFIQAIDFAYEKFMELNLDLNLLFPKIVQLYYYVQRLKLQGKYMAKAEEIIKKIYRNPNITQLIKENLLSKKENFFVYLTQGVVSSGQNLLFEQTVKDFIEESTGLTISQIKGD